MQHSEIYTLEVNLSTTTTMTSFTPTTSISHDNRHLNITNPLTNKNSTNHQATNKLRDQYQLNSNSLRCHRHESYRESLDKTMVNVIDNNDLEKEDTVNNSDEDNDDVSDEDDGDNSSPNKDKRRVDTGQFATNIPSTPLTASTCSTARFSYKGNSAGISPNLINRIDKTTNQITNQDSDLVVSSSTPFTINNVSSSREKVFSQTLPHKKDIKSIKDERFDANQYCYPLTNNSVLSCASLSTRRRTSKSCTNATATAQCSNRQNEGSLRKRNDKERSIVSRHRKERLFRKVLFNATFPIDLPISHNGLDKFTKFKKFNQHNKERLDYDKHRQMVKKVFDDEQSSDENECSGHQIWSMEEILHNPEVPLNYEKMYHEVMERNFPEFEQYLDSKYEKMLSRKNTSPINSSGPTAKTFPLDIPTFSHTSATSVYPNNYKRYKKNK